MNMVRTASEALQKYPQWVLWKMAIRNGKPTKIPYQLSGEPAKADVPATWGTYEQAVATLQHAGDAYNGIGFVFNADFTGIDLDHCVNRDGSIDGWALEILKTISSYAEISPSGGGIHIIARGLLPQKIDEKTGEIIYPGIRKRVPGAPHPDAAIEMYCTKRFFTITGNHLPDSPDSIEDCQQAIHAIYHQITSDKQKKTAPLAHVAAIPPFELSDSELLEKARNAKNGAAFSALYDRGDITVFFSQSEADQALCNMLAFWTGRDAARMDALFRRSALYREKWDRNARSGETYGEGTISRAIDGCATIYAMCKGEKASQSHANSDASHEKASIYPPIESAIDDPDKLPQVFVGGQLRDVTMQALKALRLAEQNDPIIFVQSAHLVQVARDEKRKPIIMQLGVPEIKNALTRSANYYRLKTIPANDEEAKLLPVSPPKEIAEAILAMNPSAWAFPSLAAVVETPVIRPDGTILDKPGYDPATQLYYAPHQNMESCKVPSQPTQEDCFSAVEQILDIIGDFPFAEQADKANALALMFTPILRPAIKRHVPLALIDAPKQGTGKTLLADIISIIATGDTASVLTAPDNDEEWDKRITAKLMQGSTIITIDNVPGILRSSKLDAVLTATVHEGRILGQSRMIQVPNRATWLATGNNIRLGGDLPRRCYRIRLDPQVSRPWMRTGFRHEDLASYVAEHRAELISALLTLARAWFVAEKPVDSSVPQLGTFSGWARITGSILAHAGIDGFLTNLEKLYEEADEESAQWEAFLSAWHETFGSETMTTAQLIEKINAGSADENAGSVAGSVFADTLPEALQMALKEKPTSFAIKLGKALEKRIDTCFGANNLRIERGKDSHNKQKLWKVVAGSAGSVSTPRLCEKSLSSIERSQEKENDNRNGGKHYPHYPHYPQTSDGGLCDDASLSGSTGGSTQERSLLGSEHCHGKKSALPANLELEEEDSESTTPDHAEIRALMSAVQAHVAKKKTNQLFWYGHGTGFENGFVSVADYQERVRECFRSKDTGRINAAIRAMKRTIGEEES